MGNGNTSIRIRLQYWAYFRQEPLPKRVKPVPVQVMHRIVRVAMASCDEELMAASNMIIIAYFFLVQPGNYTSKTITPLTLKDVGLYCGGQHFGSLASSEHTIRSSNHPSLEFTTQKNVLQGKVITHVASTDLIVCPTAALVRRVIHLRRAGTGPDQLLASYCQCQWWGCVAPKDSFEA